jgi:hypothetical protein
MVLSFKCLPPSVMDNSIFSKEMDRGLWPNHTEENLCTIRKENVHILLKNTENKHCVDKSVPGYLISTTNIIINLGPVL